MEWNSYTISGASKRVWDIINVPHPITCLSGTFQGSQKNWSALTKEPFAICMLFAEWYFI